MSFNITISGHKHYATREDETAAMEHMAAQVKDFVAELRKEHDGVTFAKVGYQYGDIEVFNSYAHHTGQTTIPGTVPAAPDSD